MKNVKSLKDLKNELGFYYEVKTIDKVSEGKKDLFSLLQSTILLNHKEKLECLYDLLTGKIKEEGLTIRVSECLDKNNAVMYECNNVIYDQKIRSKDRVLGSFKFLTEKALITFIIDRLHPILHNFIEDSKNSLNYSLIGAKLFKKMILKTNENARKLNYIIDFFNDMSENKIRGIVNIKIERLQEDKLIQISEKHTEFVKSIYEGKEFKLISLFFVFPKTGVVERFWHIHCIELNKDNDSLKYVFGQTDGMYEEYKIIDNDIYGFEQKQIGIYLSEKEAIKHSDEAQCI